MSSGEKENPETTIVDKEDPCGSTNPGTESTTTAANSRPEPTRTPSSGSTDEKVTAFVERTLIAMTSDDPTQDTEAQVASVEQPSSTNNLVGKASVSDPLTIIPAGCSDKQIRRAIGQDSCPNVIPAFG